MNITKKLIKRTVSKSRAALFQRTAFDEVLKRKKSNGDSSSTDDASDVLCDEESRLLSTKEDVKTDSTYQARIQALAPLAVTIDESLVKKRIQTVQEFWNFMNDQNLKAARELVKEDIRIFFTDRDKNFNMEMTWNGWAEEYEKCFNSFPDLSFDYRRVTESSGVIVVHGFKCSGTHTWAPYAFGPCEPIEASFVAVEMIPKSCASSSKKETTSSA